MELNKEQKEKMISTIIGSRLRIGRYSIPAKCCRCGIYIFLNDADPQKLPVETSRHVCTECATTDIVESQVRGGTDPLKEMMLDGINRMKNAGL